MIVLGRIIGAYGVNGWVKIHDFGGNPVEWPGLKSWWLAPSDDAASAWQERSVSGARIHSAGVVARLDGCEDRNAAEALKGLYIATPRESLPDPAADEYYWADLIGLKVEDPRGLTLGKVSGLLSTGAHDVLQVSDGEREFLIPFVAAYVLKVDREQGRVCVDWDPTW